MLRQMRGCGDRGTVVINHIVTAGTIDEQILKALDSKNSLQEELINAVKVNLKNEVKR